MIAPLFWEALELAEGVGTSASAIEKLSRATSPEAARWAIGQWELRKRAVAKFPMAAEMLFDREGLEMSTHFKVAEYHQSHFPADESIGDLTCGLGADLIALASSRNALGFETNADRAEYARFNLMVNEVRAEVLTLSSLDSRWDFEWAFADPSRRPGGKRTLDPSQFEPNLSSLVDRMSNLSLGVIKLSPMLKDDDLALVSPRLEFVSFAGECKEALAFVGRNCDDFSVTAVQVESSARLAGGDDNLPTVDEPGGYFYEADPSAIRAHALSTLSREFELEGLADSNGYLTSDHLVKSVWLRPYRVLRSGHYDP